MVRTLRARLGALCLALLATLVVSGTARAELGFVEDSFRIELSSPQAGAHADVTTSFEFRSHLGGPEGTPQPDELPKDIEVTLPPGVIGNPQATPKCAPGDFPSCPAATQVGVVELRTGTIAWMTLPVFNMEPARGKVAQFSFFAFLYPVTLTAAVRTNGDYGLTMQIPNAPIAAPLVSSRLTFWGVPGDSAHDLQRLRSCTDFGGGSLYCPHPFDPAGMYPAEGFASGAARAPFMTNPFTCGGAAPARVRANSRENPDRWAVQDGLVPVLDGCDELPFATTLSARPTTTKAGAPTGLAVDLGIPQSRSPDGIGTPPLKRAVVTLPDGMVVSPSAADGLQSCSDAQIAADSTGPVSCPQAAQIGTARIVSPLMAEPLDGEIYLGAQTPSQLLRLWLVVEGGGVRLKLPGTIDADPVTGRLTTTFDDQPQLAASMISLRFKDGPRAVLSNPRTCGVKHASATVTPYGGGAAATASDTFAVSADGNGAPCAATPFAPTLSAGTANPVAGASSSFTLRFGRSDADGTLSAIDVTLPPGLIGRVALLDRLCPTALAVAGACGEGSRIGSVRVAAGPGAPFYLPGRVYLSEGYDGAPFGLSIVVPAKAGPLDLGVVVVRAAVQLDKHTAALRIVSQKIPTILQGIPLQLREIAVTIDRDGFFLNPTSCAAKQIGATISSAEGASAARTSRFQVGDCAALRFAPKLRVEVGARGRTRRGQITALTATLTQPAGQAATRSVRLDLPTLVNTRLEVVRRACSQAVYDAGNCGDVARIGTGMALTPLLRDPLRGNAYFVKNPARRLPDIVVQLRGQVAIDVVGRVKIAGTRLTATFDTVPDVPLTKFRLTLPKERSPVGITRDLCTAAARKATATQTLRGQNGRVVQRAARLVTNGCAQQK